MKRYVAPLRRLAVAGCLLVFTSCSLFKLQLNEKGAEPLSRTELNTRLYTYQYLSAFFSELEDAVDSLKSVNRDPGITARGLIWLISNERAMQNAVFQTDPQLALADGWLLSLQVADFTRRQGDSLFGAYAPVLQQPAEQLAKRIENGASRLLPEKAYRNMKGFVEQERVAAPIRELTYSREPIYSRWLAYNDIPDTAAVATVGSLAQVIAGFSDRMSVLGGQLGKSAQWSLELAALETGFTPEKIKSLSDSTQVRIDQLFTLMNDFPLYFDTAMVQLTGGLQEVSMMLDRRIALAMQALHTERVALDSMVARERGAILVQADSISAHVAQVVMQEATSMLKSLLLYLSLFFAVILFIPFALGFATGRIFTKRKRDKPAPKKGSEAGTRS